MNLKKSLLVAVPALAMAVGALTFSFTANKKGVIEADAADYSISDRALTINNDNSVSATFTVSGSDLDMEGWLLCLFENKPSFDPSSRKLTSSNTLHPYAVEDCTRYFFVANKTASGTVSVTWAANSNDQKTNWSSTGGTDAENGTLSYYLGLSTDWYFVIGPRHYNGSWATTEEIGNGKDHIWENCDYYVGRKSSFGPNAVSGQIFLDLTESTFWDTDGAKFAVYFWNGETNAFSEFAVESKNDHIYIAPYELIFTPTNMKAVRLKSTAETPNWNDKLGNDGETGNLTFYEFSVIGVNSSNQGWVNPLATLDGLGRDVVLDHYKRNDEGKSEHYNLSVHLVEDEEFTVKFKPSETYNNYHAFTTHLSLNGVFTIVNDEIHVGEEGDYSLYFNTTGGIESLYITTPALAAADEWAQQFLGTGDNNNCNHTKNSWSFWNDHHEQNGFGDLSTEAQNLFKNATHIDHSVVLEEDYVKMAVQRYDFILEIYGTNPYYDFMGRVDAKKVTPKTSNVRTLVENNNTAMIVTIVSMISVAGLGAFLFYKKKRAQD